MILLKEHIMILIKKRKYKNKKFKSQLSKITNIFQEFLLPCKSIPKYNNKLYRAGLYYNVLNGEVKNSARCKSIDQREINRIKRFQVRK